MRNWKLSTFDLFSLGMTIKGAWTYKELPETSVLQAALDSVLCHYATGKLLEKLPGKERFTLLEVADLRGRACNVPDGFYVNNQLKFKACELNFGTGKPLRVQQAMLPDMIKFWQEEPDGPVQIIYGGFASKIMRRK